MSSMGSLANSHTITYERLLPCSLDRAWQYISSPEDVSRWRRCNSDYAIELVEGGRTSCRITPPPGLPTGVVIPAPSQGFINKPIGLVSECVPPRVLAYSFIDQSCDLASYVRFQLEECDGGVLLHFSHSHLPAQMMAQVAAGWHVHLDTMIALIKGEEPPEFLPAFGELFKKYSLIIAAGVIVASSASPALAASDDAAYRAINDQRQEFLRSYDRIWKEADRIKEEMDDLKRTNADVGRALDDLDGQLKNKYQDLKKLELNIRDLDRTVAKL